MVDHQLPWTLLVRLYQHVELGLPPRETGRDFLRAIVETDDPRLAAHLMPLTFSPDAEFRKDVAWTITRLVTRIHPGKLPALMDYTREIAGWYLGDSNWLAGQFFRHSGVELPSLRRTLARLGGEWARLKPGDLSQLTPEPFGLGILAMLTFHSSGYVREAALEGLASRWSGRELPFLLLRLNDWVPEVRNAAAQKVSDRLLPEYGSCFVNCLGLLARVRQGRRVSSDVWEAVDEFLQQRPQMERLWRHWDELDAPARRLAREIYDRLPAAEIEWWVESVAQDVNRTRREWMLHLARRRLSPEQFAPLVSMALDSRDALLRLHALWVLVQRTPEQTESLLRMALCDRSGLVRSFARHHLRRLFSVDGVDSYRKILNNPNGSVSELLGAINGLAETGTQADADRITPFLEHPRIRVRRATLQALDGLGHPDLVSLLLSRVEAPEPGVSKEAFRALRKQTGRLDANRLQALIMHGELEHVRRNAVQTLRYLPDWEAGLLLLRTLMLPDPELAELGEAELRIWLEQLYSKSIIATPTQAASLQAVLDQCPVIAPDLRERLRWIFSPVSD